MHEEIEALFRLDGKTAMVTGGAVHLGYDCASTLAAAGADVAISSRDIEKAKKSAAVLEEKYGVAVLPVALDQTDPLSVAAAFARVMEWKGRLDVMVNNAGGGAMASNGNFLENDPKNIFAMIDLNLTGAIYCCREAGRIMAPKRRGKIINIASMAGLFGRDRRMYARSGMSGQPVEYAAAKAGIIGLTRDLAAYLAPMGVYVNCISPGGTKGPDSTLPAGFVKDYEDRTPIGRFGEYGKDIKGAIIFLAGAASDYVTGQNVVVDGGFSIWH
jgi:NAD(P)-dependent dehydrogenase (short-subunit alcohol dehydrogenase family)